MHEEPRESAGNKKSMGAEVGWVLGAVFVIMGFAFSSTGIWMLDFVFLADRSSRKETGLRAAPEGAAQPLIAHGADITAGMDHAEIPPSTEPHGKPWGLGSVVCLMDVDLRAQWTYCGHGIIPSREWILGSGEASAPA